MKDSPPPPDSADSPPSPSSASPTPKGPWIHRFSIWSFTLLFSLLIYWLLGFLVEDIKNIEGPDYGEIEARYVDQNLIDRRSNLQSQIQDLNRSITNQQEALKITSDTSRNLQTTINQLIDLQKLSLEKAVELPESEQANLSESLTHFLESQKKYQEGSAQLADLAEQKRSLEEESVTLDKSIQEQRIPASREYQQLNKKHNLKLAAYQLAILIPLLGLGAWMFIKKRGSIYFPMVLGFGFATLIKVLVVVHAYFPARYFRYILVIGLLLAIIKLLVAFIRMVAYPKAQWLIKQYREAYEKFLCPICEFPIRTGPRKFLVWTRRTARKVELPRGGDAQSDEAYACPSCGTSLFEECKNCGKIRHGLLPHCQHCNAPVEISGKNGE